MCCDHPPPEMALERGVPDAYLYKMNMHSSNSKAPKARHSASANSSRKAALDRLRATTVEERMRMALSLGRRMSGWKPVKREGI